MATVVRARRRLPNALRRLWTRRLCIPMIFASWEEPLDWWPRLLEQVLRPLADGNVLRYQRYDWTLHQLGEWVDVAVCAYVVLEGVSSSRDAFQPYLSFA